jgi:hypothetical protein
MSGKHECPTSRKRETPNCYEFLTNFPLLLRCGASMKVTARERLEVA